MECCADRGEERGKETGREETRSSQKGIQQQQQQGGDDGNTYLGRQCQSHARTHTGRGVCVCEESEQEYISQTTGIS